MSRYVNARERVYNWFLNNGGYPVKDDGHIFACAKDNPSVPLKKVAEIVKEFLNPKVKTLIICNGWAYLNIPKNKDMIKKALEKDIATAEKEAKKEADAILGGLK